MSGSNSATNALVEVAAFSVSRALGDGLRGGVAGLAVQPITWAVTGNGPDAADAFIYGSSAVGAVAGMLVAAPGIVTGIVKNLIDDHNDTLLEEVRADEPRAVRNGITKADNFSFFANMNRAQAGIIAGKGGVCWQHPNGLYCYLEDSEGLPVCDYMPQVWKALYKPYMPLRFNGQAIAYQSRERHR